MTRLMQEKAEKLKADFDCQPCGKVHGIVLDRLTDTISEFSMPVSLRDCVIDIDKTCVVQGGVIAILADFAGVYLARLYSESDAITPLVNLDEHYFRPVILGKDEKIVARAFISEITDNRIHVKVLVENEKGDSKGQACLTFAKRFKN